MTIQTEAAKAGVKLSWAAIKVIAFIVLVLVVCALLAWSVHRSNQIQTELTALRDFRAQTEARNRVSDATTSAAATARIERAAQNESTDRIIIEHTQATKEAANEDPRTADFLDARIPQRLRDADARARRSGRLEEGRR